MNPTEMTERFNLASSNYDEQRKFFIPCFDDFYKTSISFLAECRNDFKYILDLGAGTGLLTKFMIERFPYAKYLLVDISDKMLEAAKTRFENIKNVEYEVMDYSKEIYCGKYDLISSALSIHHLDNDEKNVLYKNIYNNLNDGGYFINLDQFNAGNEFINRKYNEWWYKYIENSKIEKSDKDKWLKRRELDKENTIEETIAILKSAGFKNTECIYSFMKFGVTIAVK